MGWSFYIHYVFPQKYIKSVKNGIITHEPPILNHHNKFKLEKPINFKYNQYSSFLSPFFIISIYFKLIYASSSFTILI